MPQRVPISVIDLMATVFRFLPFLCVSADGGSQSQDHGGFFSFFLLVSQPPAKANKGSSHQSSLDPVLVKRSGTH